jgi:hypothetical protein
MRHKWKQYKHILQDKVQPTSSNITNNIEQAQTKTRIRTKWTKLLAQYKLKLEKDDLNLHDYL